MNNIETILDKERNGFETKVETHERLYGKNSCFLVGESYQSLYNDDYCGFKYYSNVTGEYFEDSWSTAYACPPYSCFEVEMKFDKAKELGLIDKEKFNKNWEHTVHEIGSFYENNPMEWATFFKRFPQVEVYRGRSFKGRKGLLIAQKKICPKGYPSLMAVVFDTEENEFFMVKLQYVKLTSDFISSIKEATNKRIEEEYKVEDRLRHFALEEEKEVIDKLLFDGNWKEFSENIYNLYSKFLMKYEAEEEKKKYAPTEKLIQWVRDHFKDVKDEEEIYKIAFNISKKNSRY